MKKKAVLVTGGLGYIGTGKGTSVQEIINVFERDTGVKLNYCVGKRREGDAAAVFAYTKKASDILGWKDQLSIEDMIASVWKWEQTLL